MAEQDDENSVISIEAIPCKIMPETKNKPSVDWARVLNGFALILCTVSLALIAFSLRPLAKWASFQSICIEQESIKAPINWSVRKCNGRSKVYQVK